MNIIMKQKDRGEASGTMKNRGHKVCDKDKERSKDRKKGHMGRRKKKERDMKKRTKGNKV